MVIGEKVISKSLLLLTAFMAPPSLFPSTRELAFGKAS